MHASTAIRGGALLLALCFVLPASAQKLSLGERVARLEQQSAEQNGSAGQANVELLNRLTAMQTEVQALRNQVEQLQNENEQLKQQGKDQYLDLDSRLQRLETTPAAPASGNTGIVPPSVPGRPASGAASSPRPPSGASAAPPANAGGEQAAYDVALAALRKGDFVESARSFQAYLGNYPNGNLAPNAWYWLGESYYATQNYPIALQSFDTLLGQFPESPKASDAMLKKGYCQIEMGQTGPGRQTLNRVVNEFPGSDAARLAASRLRGLSLDAR